MAAEPNSTSLVSSSLLRFSIRQLLLGTALVAVACVALRNAGGWWVSALLAVTVLVLTAAVLLALFRERSQRAFWIGFALVGWAQFSLLLYAWSLDPNTSHNNPLRLDTQFTSIVSNAAYMRIYGYPQPMYGGGGFGGGVFGPGGFGPGGVGMGGTGGGFIPGTPAGPPPAPVAWIPNQPDFVSVAHAFWTLLLALCGGWFARWLYATGPAARQEPVAR
ncbi:MAG: hypothetical protein WD872_16275 [Pirellulaceae bacterium]